MKTTIAIITAAALAGCSPPPEMVEVKCIAVHRYGDTKDKAGWQHERFTYMTVERLDTHERRNFTQIFGQTNDVFVMDWTSAHYK